jgi:hypothetical protein
MNGSNEGTKRAESGGSVFREKEWRGHRHLLNPSKLKEYELHAVGLGFLNRFNFLKDYKERFAHIDTLTEEELSSLHRRTTLHLLRKELSEGEREMLQKHGFRLRRRWGTLILNINTEVKLDDNTAKNIRKGEKRLEFMEIKTVEEFEEYYKLFRSSRRELHLNTPRRTAYNFVRRSPHYVVFCVKDRETGRIVAGLGTIQNRNYLLEVNAARDRKYFYANDYLKWKIIGYCRQNSIPYYDFAGCNPAPKPGSKDFNLRVFKEKWGGEFYYEYVFGR